LAQANKKLLREEQSRPASKKPINTPDPKGSRPPTSVGTKPSAEKQKAALPDKGKAKDSPAKAKKGPSAKTDWRSPSVKKGDLIFPAEKQEKKLWGIQHIPAKVRPNKRPPVSIPWCTLGDHHGCCVQNARPGRNPLKLRIAADPHKRTGSLLVTDWKTGNAIVGPRYRHHGPYTTYEHPHREPGFLWRFLIIAGKVVACRDGMGSKKSFKQAFHKNLKFFGFNEGCESRLRHLIKLITVNGASLRDLRSINQIRKIWFYGQAEKAYRILRGVVKHLVYVPVPLRRGRDVGRPEKAFTESVLSPAAPATQTRDGPGGILSRNVAPRKGNTLICLL